MENVLFDEKAEKNMHTLSKVIHIIAKVFTVFCYIGLAFIILGLITVPVLLGHVDTKKSVFKVAGKEYRYSFDDKKITIYDGDEELVSEEMNVNVDLNEIISEHPSSYYIGVTESVLTLGGISVVIIILFLKHLSKLFKNISEDDTPFSEENILHLRKMAMFLIAGICISVVGNFLIAVCAGFDYHLHIDFTDVIYILILLCMSYVFSYGLKLEKPEKPKKSVKKK